MKRRTTRAAAFFGAVALAMIGAVAAAQPAPAGDPLATDLNHPRGLTQDGEDILVAELGAGSIVRITPTGETIVEVTGLPTTTFFSEETGAEEAAGPSAVIAVDGGWAVTISEGPEASMQSLYFVAADGETELIADLGAYETENNTDEGLNPAGEPDLLSNPYDLVAYEDGYLVSNSGANAILHVDADGTVSPFAIFEARENPLFPDMGGPTMQQVPTGLTEGPDGAIYVGTLTGFPFPSGAAQVYRLEDANDDGDALDEGEVTVYATGLTTVTDIDFDASGALIVSEFSTNILAEAPGRVVRVVDGAIEVVASGLITPTAVLVSGDRILASQEFAGMVSDVTDVGDVAPPSGAAFTGEIAASGTSTVTFAGGTVADLEAAATSSGATSVVVFVGGEAIVLIPGAPAFVNAAFNAAFSAGVEADQIVLITIVN